MPTTIKTEAIDAAIKVLSKRFDLQMTAKVSSYIWDGQTEQQRANGLDRLKNADIGEIEQTRAVIAEAIEAAIKAQGNAKVVRGEV